MATCTTKISAGLDPSCNALDKIGGVDKTIYFGNLDEITFTETSDRITGITMETSPASYLYKFIGKTKKHNATYELQVGENTNTWKQAVIMKLYFYDATERAAIEALCTADDLVAFVQNESGVWEVYGASKGIRAEAATGATGILIQDDTSITITISGEETRLPRVLKLGAADPGADAYVQQNIDALDLLT